MSLPATSLGQLSEHDARTLTDQIVGTLTTAHGLIVQAFQGRADLALGYVSWDAYCATEFAGNRMVRLDREQRREIVAEMRSVGMSTRAIGSALGTPQRTIADDVTGLSETAQTVTSLDGRRRPAQRVDRETGEVDPPARATPRRALPDAFFDASYDLTKAVERVTRLAEDDRFPQNAEQVAAKHRDDLIRARDALQGVINRLPSA